MPELLWARGGYAGTFGGLGAVMLELVRVQGGLGGGYAGTFGGLEWVCRNFCGVSAGYAGTFWGLGGGMPERLWA